MKITNIYGLPEPVVRAVTPRETPESRRKGADISVTELLGPPRVKQLRELCWEDLTQDASEMLWAMLGTALHDILERNSGWELSEKRISMVVDGMEISGKFDLVSEGGRIRKLVDYKSTSVWAMIMGGRQGWEEQINLYRLLMHENGLEVPQELENVLFFRDWNRRDRETVDGYPPAAMMVLPQKVWTIERARAFAAERVAEHKREMPECTPLERWRKGDLWAIQKKGAKRAFRVVDSEYAAYAQLKQLHEEGKTDMVVEHRPGEDKRCAEFCAVREFCDHGRQVLGLPPLTSEPE